MLGRKKIPLSANNQIGGNDIMKKHSCSSLLIVMLICIGITMLHSQAQARVGFSGTVRVWNPITNTYEPLQNTRLRLVLWEDVDWDTGDIETRTDDNGHYDVSKCNPWDTGYHVFIKAIAETDKLEVQSEYPQVDGYQAYSREYWVVPDSSIVINLDIAGSASNVNVYKVGGISDLGSSHTTSSINGERAFFICHEMTNHRKLIVRDTVIPDSVWEEKEVVFPYNDDATANYSGTWDAIYFPDRGFPDSTLSAVDYRTRYERISETCRHELSHGLMADSFGAIDMPGPWAAESHRYWEPMSNDGKAWSEGFADFMAQFTFFKRYGHMTHDIISPNAPERGVVTPSLGRRNTVEGEIASCLWSIIDPVGWKTAGVQNSIIPGEEQYYDAFADPRLELFWPIFNDNEPQSFVDGDRGGSSLVKLLLDRYSDRAYYDRAMRILLYNRGIQMWDEENKPRIFGVTDPTWNGCVATMTMQIAESDQSDLDHLAVEVYANGQRQYRQQLSNLDWSPCPFIPNGQSAMVPVTYTHVPPAPGHSPSTRQAQPRIDIVLDDGMEYEVHTNTITPPPSAQITDLRCDIIGLSVENPGSDMVKGLSLDVIANNGPDIHLPSAGTWQIDKGKNINITAETPVFRYTSVPNTINLMFKLQAVGMQKPVIVTNTYTDDDNLGIGDHTITLKLGDLSGPRLRLTYMIYVPNAAREASSRIDVDRLLGREISLPVYARNTNAETIKKAAVNKTDAIPGQNIRILMGKANRLLQDYVHVQEECASAAEELQTKLSENKPVNSDKSSKNDLSNGPLLLIPRRNTLLIEKPDTPFLDKASQGQGIETKLSKERLQVMQELRESIADMETRLRKLQAGAPSLRGELLASAQAVRDSHLDEAAKNKSLTGVTDMADRLAEITPSSNEFDSIIGKEIQTLDCVLGKQNKPIITESQNNAGIDSKDAELAKIKADQDTKEQAVKEQPAKTQSSVQTSKSVRMAESVRWRLEVLNISEADEYLERYYSEKKVITPKEKGQKLIVLACRLTNKLDKVATPVLSEKLAGSTALTDSSGKAFLPLDYDAAQASNKWQDYSAAPMAPGGSTDFALIFAVAQDAKPSVLIYNLLTYPDDVGGDGKVVKIPLD